MKLFVAYTEKNTPVAISRGVESTISRIKEIESEYKTTSRSLSLVGRTYEIWEVDLVPNKISPDDIVRTLPIRKIQIFSTNESN